MDKQKQIQTEELIGIIQGAVGGCATHWASLIAEEVLKYYQPKIPENAVVLTREEYNFIDHNIKHLESVCNAHEKTIAYWEEQTKVARQELFEERKETAEKFAERVSQAIVDNTYPYFDKDGKPVNIWKAVIGFDTIDEIAKEIVEGKRCQECR